MHWRKFKQGLTLLEYVMKEFILILILSNNSVATSEHISEDSCKAAGRSFKVKMYDPKTPKPRYLCVKK